MEFFSDIWNSVTGVFQAALELIHGVFVGPFGDDPAWGWAIIALTLLIRVALLPLAVKQTRSMKAMQELQPQIKKIQDKYKANRDLMKKDPELYRKRKAEQNAKMMELYQEEGVNPASSCLPLLAQAPVFLALFSVLRGFDELRDAQFYWVTSDIASDAAGAGLGALVSEAGWPGWVLIAAMVVSMFITQKQTMARTSAEGPAAQQQKIMLYVLPVFLAFISRTLPLGVIVYWVTTNIWQGVQQWIIFREGGLGTARGGSSSEDAPEDKGSGGGSSNGAAKELPKSEKPAKGSGSPKNGGSSNGSRTRKGTPARRGDGHVPKRRSS